MGNLLSLRSDKSNFNSDVFVDFENAKPKGNEVELYNYLAAVLGQSKTVIEKLRTYNAVGGVIAKAISKPSMQTENEAWNAVLPQVGILKVFYEYASAIEGILPKILQALASGDPLRNLEEKQAVCKQFADLLWFVMEFDELKMRNPGIQNDFSYYRRTLGRLKMSDAQDVLSNLVVRDELANKMSYFLAVPTPMLNAVVNATTNFVGSNNVPQDHVLEVLSTMAAICHNAVHDPERAARFRNPGTVLFCLRVMVSVIILYDHVSPQGAFHKNSAINMKSSIKLIQAQGPGEQTDSLLNALRYTTKHMADADTPKQIKQLLA